MKKRALSLVVLVGFFGAGGVIAHAQTDYNEGLKEELNQEIDQLYPKKKKARKAQPQQVVQVQEVAGDSVQPAPATPTTINVTTAAPAQPQAQQQVAQPQMVAAQPQPIYIMQAPTVQAQQQPTTTVEGNSIRESKVDQLRKQREEVERQTEEKLIQRLEDDRLSSEKDRADRLLNPANPANLKNDNSQAVQQGPANPLIGQPAQAVGNAPVQVVPAAGQVEAAVPAAPLDQQQEEKSVLQVGGVVGVGEYPTVSNVTGVYAAGVDVGLIMPGGLGVEGTFLYSSYDVNVMTITPLQAPLVRMDQMNVDAALTYRFLSGRVRPLVGVLAGYTRRSFQDAIYFSGYQNQSTISHSIDYGLIAGVDIAIAKKFSVGADIRYFINMSSRTDNPYAYSTAIGKPIDSLNYYFATLNLKLDL